MPRADRVPLNPQESTELLKPVVVAYAARYSTWAAARKYGVPRQVVLRWVKEAGIKL